MRTLRTYPCPKCGEFIPDARNEWALWRIDEPFRCPRCSTMLRLAIPWRSACAISITIAMLIPVEIVILASADDFLFGSGWIAAIQKYGLVIAVWWVATLILGKAPGHRLIVHSNE